MLLQANKRNTLCCKRKFWSNWRQTVFVVAVQLQWHLQLCLCMPARSVPIATEIAFEAANANVFRTVAKQFDLLAGDDPIGSFCVVYCELLFCSIALSFSGKIANKSKIGIIVVTLVQIGLLARACNQTSLALVNQHKTKLHTIVNSAYFELHHNFSKKLQENYNNNSNTECSIDCASE